MPKSSGFRLTPKTEFLRPYLVPSGRMFDRYAWPGGYPIIYVTGDGGTLCNVCVSRNWKQIREATDSADHRSGWSLLGVEIHYEGPDEVCANCNREIPSAYGDPDAGQEVGME